MKHTKMGLPLALCLGLLPVPALSEETQQKETVTKEESTHNDHEKKFKFIERILVLSAASIIGLVFFGSFIHIMRSAFAKQVRIDAIREREDELHLTQAEAEAKRAVTETEYAIEKLQASQRWYHWLGSFFDK